MRGCRQRNAENESKFMRFMKIKTKSTMFRIQTDNYKAMQRIRRRRRRKGNILPRRKKEGKEEKSHHRLLSLNCLDREFYGS